MISVSIKTESTVGVGRRTVKDSDAMYYASAKLNLARICFDGMLMS